MNSRVEEILSSNEIDAEKIRKVSDDAGRMKDVFQITDNNSKDYAVYVYRQTEGGERGRSIKERVAAEKHIYGKIRENTSLRAPQVLDSGTDFILCTWLDGDIIGSWEQSDEQVSHNKKEEISFRMGEALSEIHEVSYGKFGELCSEGLSREYNSWSKFVLDLIEEMRNNSNNEVIQEGLDYLEENIDLMKYNPDPVLLHGDFHDGNILKGKKLGIVDCEAGFAGAREYEIDRCLFHWAEEWNTSEEFMKGYGNQKLSENWSERKVYYRILHSVRGMIDGMNLGSSHLVNINEEELKEKLKEV